VSSQALCWLHAANQAHKILKFNHLNYKLLARSLAPIPKGLSETFTALAMSAIAHFGKSMKLQWFLFWREFCITFSIILLAHVMPIRLQRWSAKPGPTVSGRSYS
jgi:hypothetical protein